MVAAIDEEDATADGDLEWLVLHSSRIRSVVDMNGFISPLHHADAIATSLVSTDVESASAITSKRIGSLCRVSLPALSSAIGIVKQVANLLGPGGQ